MALVSRAGILLAVVAALAAPANGQRYDTSVPAGGPFSRVPVLNAPFAAEATTIFRELLPRGTVRTHTVTARYYRDSRGRVRSELDTPWRPYVVVAIPTPDRVAFYMLNPTERTYRYSAHSTAAQLFNGEGRVALPVGKACFQNAPPVVGGVSDVERLHAVYAQVSPDLGIVTESHRSDTIPVDYEVTNIRRGEPLGDLFEVPTDYTLMRGFHDGVHDDPLVTFSSWHSPPRCVRPILPTR
jgi:hypothetical protein